MSLTPLHLWHLFFVLLTMNSLLPAELKFRENISDAGLCVFVLMNIKRSLFFSTAIFIADLFVYTFLISIVKHYMMSFTFNVTPISTTRKNVAVRLCLMLFIFPLFIHFLRMDSTDNTSTSCFFVV